MPLSSFTMHQLYIETRPLKASRKRDNGATKYLPTSNLENHALHQEFQYVRNHHRFGRKTRSM